VARETIRPNKLDDMGNKHWNVWGGGVQARVDKKESEATST